MKVNSVSLFSISALGVCVLSILASSQAHAHGFMDVPKARQAFCQQQGGYWWPEDGSGIANLACRAAFVEAGHYQFVQEHEFSANTADYRNQAAIQQSVPDGQLCSAGDNNKRGIDIPSIHWPRTEMTVNGVGEIKVRFKAVVPHNPSFWRFYLSKPDFDASTQALTWNDLTLIDTFENIDTTVSPEGDRYYEMNVAVPAGRSGDAILYTHWQREDAAGEGFFNCSDIVIKADTTPVDPTQWQDVGHFVKQGQQAQVGDSIWVRLFDASGSEVIDQFYAVTSEYHANWQEHVAVSLNQDYGHLVQVGLQDAQGEISYQSQDPLVNKVYSKDGDYTFQLSVQVAPENTPPTVMKPDDVSLLEGTTQSVHVHAFDEQQSILNFTWDVPQPLSYSSSGGDITINAPQVDSDSNFTITVTVDDGALSASTRFQVTVVNDQTTIGEYPQWSATAQYQASERVSFAGNDYEAKWWNEGAQPDTSEAWKRISNTDEPLQWHINTPYSGGAVVVHEGAQYRAKWWTQGDEPGLTQVWEAL
ncbi:lytic polysaccharide monooxygenase [Pseudoalteromonas pernae]|uniref:lytic polysaccharide monooxygenase n=1 Tax=Pseudoalteromonas pernae TaxID=3118054 RepID=UPI0032423036